MCINYASLEAAEAAHVVWSKDASRHEDITCFVNYANTHLFSFTQLVPMHAERRSP